MPKRQFVGWMGLFALGLAVISCEKKAAEPSVPPTEQEAAPATVDAAAIEASLAAADQYFNSNELGKARTILAVLIDRAPGEVRARELYGQTLSLLAIKADDSGDPEEAKNLRVQAYEQYEVAVDLEPESEGLQHSAGMIAVSAGLTKEALEHFLEAGRLDPSDVQPPLFAAQMLLMDRRLGDAEVQLERARRIDPDQPMIYASLAIIALERGDFEEARREIARARTLDPNDLGLLAQEARIHRRAGDPRRALELLVLLNETQRAQEAVAVELGAGYLAIGEPEKAAEVWKNRIQVTGETPGSWRDALRVADAYLQADQREQAWLWLQDAKTKAPMAHEVAELEARFTNP